MHKTPRPLLLSQPPVGGVRVVFRRRYMKTLRCPTTSGISLSVCAASVPELDLEEGTQAEPLAGAPAESSPTRCCCAFSHASTKTCRNSRPCSSPARRRARARCTRCTSATGSSSRRASPQSMSTAAEASSHRTRTTRHGLPCEILLDFLPCNRHCNRPTARIKALSNGVALAPSAVRERVARHSRVVIGRRGEGRGASGTPGDWGEVPRRVLLSPRDGAAEASARR